MKKLSLITLLIVSLFLIGCTSPTQPYAAEDLRLAGQQYRTIVSDLSTIAKQQALDKAYKVVTESEVSKERGNALIAMSDTYQDVSWLQEQAMIAHELLRSGRQWVQAQKGIFNVVAEDWAESKKRVEEAGGGEGLQTKKIPAPK